MGRLAWYGFGLAALSAIGAAFFLPSSSEAPNPARIRADVNAAIEERIGHPWRVRRLRVAAIPISGPSGPFLIDAEVELDEPTFIRLEQVNGITFGDHLGLPGFTKRLRGKIWLDQASATTLVRLDIDNADTLGQMGTPQSGITGRVLVRGSDEARQWVSVSGCFGTCLPDRLGEIKHGENGHRREQNAEGERADEAEASRSPDEADKHRQQ
jgi:hypothetical protein